MPEMGLGVMRYINSYESQELKKEAVTEMANNTSSSKKQKLKISKQALLPEDQAGCKVTYYSKVAEVNEKGELSGDETTLSCTSHSDDDAEDSDNDAVHHRNRKSTAAPASHDDDGENQSERNRAKRSGEKLAFSTEMSFKEHSQSASQEVVDVLSARTLAEYFGFHLVVKSQVIGMHSIRVDLKVIEKYQSLIKKQPGIAISTRSVFKGNVLPAEGKSLPGRRGRSLLKRLGPDFQAKTSMLSKGGTFYDSFMRNLPNRKMRETFKKKEFKKLKIIGQFNLGFIICTLESTATGDLLILDQHALDERRNLEKYQKVLKIDTQTLLKPITTEVSYLQATLMLKYHWIFSQNGMRVQLPANLLDMDESVETVQIRIVSMPQSNDTQFAESDFYDLLSGVSNYDLLCKRANSESLLDDQSLLEKLRTRKV